MRQKIVFQIKTMDLLKSLIYLVMLSVIVIHFELVNQSYDECEGNICVKKTQKLLTVTLKVNLTNLDFLKIM